MNTLKAILGGVDFQTYALSPISQYTYRGRKLSELKML